MCFPQLAVAIAGAKAVRPGKMAITPAAKQEEVGDASTKSDLAADQLKKKGLRSTILAGSDQPSTGGNTLLGGG